MVINRKTAVQERGPRSRQGFARGKSITYGRLSPPLSSFNHTLCEQNIKTCPFVCRRRIVVDPGCGLRRGEVKISERESGAGGSGDDYGPTWPLYGVYLIQSFPRCSYKEVRVCTAMWGRLAPSRAPRCQLATIVIGGRVQIKSLFFTSLFSSSVQVLFNFLITLLLVWIVLQSCPVVIGKLVSSIDI